MKKNQKISKVLLATVSVTQLFSCAGPESYQQKMARYTPKTIGKNQVPEIKTADIKFTSEKSTISRAPASAPETPNKDVSGNEGNPTNKKLYFLTLYTQYESIKKYSTDFQGPSVSICPNFHTSLLRHNELHATANQKRVDKKFSYDSKRYFDESYVSALPELMLPLSKDETTPRVIDVIRSSKDSLSDFAINELVHKALDMHLEKTYSEIRELCEYGVSDNYYIYENLITHIKSNKFEADTKNMNTLLKTTLFSNMALMTSLEKHDQSHGGRSIASVEEDKKIPYATELMARLNVKWANQYFDYIRKTR
ncbi:MAG: hypothetical protein ACXVLQ_06725 [Bacteriovorax sp.]